jgi:CRISPR-associated endonuclease/helicase Cas3
MDYPLITACPRRQDWLEVPVPADASQQRLITSGRDDTEAVAEALARAEQGQQVLWIENTVQEAQQRYLDLAARAAELGVDCGLLHSRYTAADRQAIEHEWVNRFGSAGWPQRGSRGRILVGTQVLEQSLDIDADFMVTRFAPTDMLLQRLGRLWRHTQTPRNVSATPEAWILAPELEPAVASPQTAFGSTAFVYSPYVLCRSLEVWQGVVDLTLPDDIRDLIERTYSPRTEQGLMLQWLAELNDGTRWRKGRKALQQLARVTLAEAGNTLPEHKAQTRFSETDNLDVLLVRQLRFMPAENATCLTLLNGEQQRLPRRRQALSKARWRELSATLMRQVVSVRIQDAPLALALKTLEDFGLQHCFYLGNPANDEALLRVVLVDESGYLQGVNGAPLHGKYQLEYRNDLGYRIIKD